MSPPPDVSPPTTCASVSTCIPFTRASTGTTPMTFPSKLLHPYQHASRSLQATGADQRMHNNCFATPDEQGLHILWIAPWSHTLCRQRQSLKTVSTPPDMARSAGHMQCDAVLLIRGRNYVQGLRGVAQLVLAQRATKTPHPQHQAPQTSSWQLPDASRQPHSGSSSGSSPIQPKACRPPDACPTKNAMLPPAQIPTAHLSGQQIADNTPGSRVTYK